MEVTIWRLAASAANSRGVQASTGRPDSVGEVQARLMIWMICSAVKVGGTPGRGASASTSAMSGCKSASSWSTLARSGWAWAQRARQRRMVLGEQASRAANGSLRSPAAAAKMMEMRRARAWGQECWRSKRSRTARWCGETRMATGGGPDIGSPWYCKVTTSDVLGSLSYHNPVATFAELY